MYFPPFIAARMGQKIGRRPQTQLCGDAFDLLLQDYWDFELIRRTQGRREATAADEEAVDELCQPYLDWKKEALK